MRHDLHELTLVRLEAYNSELQDQREAILQEQRRVQVHMDRLRRRKDAREALKKAGLSEEELSEMLAMMPE